MALYYVETSQGCGIREGRSPASVRKELARDVGIYNVEKVTRATPDNISWVRQMGGYLPDAAKEPRQ